MLTNTSVQEGWYQQYCGAGAGPSRYFLVGAGVKVRLRLHLR